jgi:hypothetical protein
VAEATPRKMAGQIANLPEGVAISIIRNARKLLEEQVDQLLDEAHMLTLPNPAAL